MAKAIIEAAAKGDMSTLKRLLEEGSEVEKEKGSPMRWALGV